MPSETVPPQVLKVGPYQLTMEDMPTIESPRILIKDKVEGAQGLRMLLEGLILFAREQTDEEMRIVTFSNQVSPFGPIAKDEAQTILHQWFDVVRDRNSPCPLIIPSSSKQPARLQKILNMLSGYTGATNPSAFILNMNDCSSTTHRYHRSIAPW